MRVAPVRVTRRCGGATGSCPPRRITRPTAHTSGEQVRNYQEHSLHEIFNYTVHSLLSDQAPPVPQQAGTSGGSSPASTSSTASAASAVNLSATARSILETLEKMSTPLKDAHKMPVPRAEKRKAIAEELLQGKFRNNSDNSKSECQIDRIINIRNFLHKITVYQNRNTG